MDDFVAYPSRWRLALLVLMGIGFVVTGAWIVGFFGPPPNPRHAPKAVGAIIGWSAILFFGLCVIAITRRLFDGREQVCIDKAGIRFARWSDATIPWSEINRVTIWRYKNTSSIILHLREPARFPASGILAKLAGANRFLTGGDVAITLVGTNRRFADAIAAIERHMPVG